MIDFKHHNKLLEDALKANKKLLDSSQNSLNEIQSKVLQNKDKFSSEELAKFDEAIKQAEEMKNQLKGKHGV